MNLIMAFFKIYKFTNKNIYSSILNKEYALLNCGLKAYRYKTRGKILTALLTSNLSDSSLLKRLIFILKNDFLENSAIANEVLEQSSITNPKLMIEYENAKVKYLERLRKDKHLNAFLKSHKTTPVKGLLFDKSSMVRLNRVKQQLKKSIRGIG